MQIAGLFMIPPPVTKLFQINLVAVHVSGSVCCYGACRYVPYLPMQQQITVDAMRTVSTIHNECQRV